MQLHNLYYVMFCCLNSKMTETLAELRSANAKTAAPSCWGLQCFVSMKALKLRLCSLINCVSMIYRFLSDIQVFGPVRWSDLATDPLW